VSALAIDEDGKIVVAGWISSTNDFFVARYNPDGTLDTTFSGDGIVIDSFVANFHEPNGVAIDPNGSIVVVGRTGASLFMARYLPDGTLDPTFSGDGHSVGGIAAKCERLQCGRRLPGPDRHRGNGDCRRQLAVVRRPLSANGTLDSSLDGDGIVLYAGTSQSRRR
jgi:uncharacterized delta-60 repeat protein